MAANTQLLGLNQPTSGSDSGIWGDEVNNGFTQLVDLSIAGTNNITYDGDVTLSITSGTNSSAFTSTTTTTTSTAISQYAVLNCTGSRAAARNIIVPSYSKIYAVYNNTTVAITIKKSGGTGVAIAAGEKALVYYDNVTATDVIRLVSSTILGTVTTGTWNATIIGTAYGGTGLGGSTPYTSGGAVYASSASVLTSGVLPVAGGGTGNANLTFPTGTVSIGYLNIPQNAQTSTYILVLTDSGKQIYMAAAQAATTYTIPANSSVAFPVGTVVQFLNMSVNNMTISINTDTLTWSNGGSAGSRTLSQYGVANCVKVTSTQWLITGVNLT